MTQNHVTSVELSEMVLGLGPIVNHAEFRALMLAADYPDGVMWTAPISVMHRLGRLHLSDLQDAAARLNNLPGVPFEITVGEKFFFVETRK